MNNNIKDKIDNTIDYLIDNSLDSLTQIKKDPENVIWESELDLNDNDYNDALDYIKTWNHGR